MVSGCAPPSGGTSSVKLMPEVIGALRESFTVPANVNPFNPLGAPPTDVGYVASITSPLTNASPSTPSPKTNSCLLLSDSSRKKILLILLTAVMSVASRYASV